LNLEDVYSGQDGDHQENDVDCNKDETVCGSDAEISQGNHRERDTQTEEKTAADDSFQVCECDL